jgi:hypothetical protein
LNISEHIKTDKKLISNASVGIAPVAAATVDPAFIQTGGANPATI